MTAASDGDYTLIMAAAMGAGALMYLAEDPLRWMLFQSKGEQVSGTPAPEGLTPAEGRRMAGILLNCALTGFAEASIAEEGL